MLNTKGKKICDIHIHINEREKIIYQSSNKRIREDKMKATSVKFVASWINKILFVIVAVFILDKVFSIYDAIGYR